MPQIRGKQQGVQKWHPLKGNRVKAKLSRIYIKGGIFAYWWLPKNPVYFSICHIPYWHVSIAITGLMIDWLTDALSLRLTTIKLLNTTTNQTLSESWRNLNQVLYECMWVLFLRIVGHCWIWNLMIIQISV